MEKQLKATGLRIGNLVFSPDDNQIISLTGCDIFMLENNHYREMKFSPIPLSEDVLLRLGFEIDSVDRPILHADYKVINPITHDYMIELKNVGKGWFYRNGHFKINYVHQLQNLYFALTGEELTFKN